MNRSILLVISDFLILSLLALARFDAPVTQDATPASETEARPGASLESELIDILKASLESEKEQQAALASELKTVQENVEAKDQDIVQREQTLEQTLRTLEEERLRASELASQRDMLMKEQGQLASDLLRLREQNAVERERLRQAQFQIDEKEKALSESRQNLSQVAEEKAAIEKEKQQVLTELRVVETQRTLIEQQLKNTQIEIEIERQQREAAQRRTDELSEGVRILAGTSVEIKDEIRQLQPQTPNALFTEFKRNRVEIKFNTEYPGVFQNRQRTSTTKTILISDGRQTYAIFHAKGTPFDLNEITPKYLRMNVEIILGETVFSAQEIGFLNIDPRLLVIAIPEAYTPHIETAVYPIVIEPFRFPDAVIIAGNENYFGESSFRVHPQYSRALQMDQRVLSRLFGEFSPSTGDLVIAKTGEFMGIMVNQDYAGLVDHISITDRIPVGDSFDTGLMTNTLNSLAAKIMR